MSIVFGKNFDPTPIVAFIVTIVELIVESQ
jgi:hypothetical protein